jgi:gluconate 5-dehydrogenase
MTQLRHFDLSGKTALITGASRGIGLATAFMLARQGAKVYLNARNAEELRKIAAQFQQEGLQGVPCPFDAFETQAGQVAIDQIIAESGGLDIVFLNAAIQSRAPLFEFKSEDFLRLVIGNLVSQWELGRYAAKHMAQRKTGRIVFTGSILALMGRENVSGYTASKAAIHGIIRQWSAELAPSGISVNGVAPGYVKTQLTSALHNDERFCAWLQSRTPMRRWARPEDIASAVTFLASDEAGFMTGQVLVVDGGLTSSLY